MTSQEVSEHAGIESFNLIVIAVLKSDDRVTAQMIFIGSLQDQAEQ
jgi:hypothetical protein